MDDEYNIEMSEKGFVYGGGSVLTPSSCLYGRGPTNHLPLNAFLSDGVVLEHHHREESEVEVDAMKAKIIAHPHYSNLIQAYMDCQKVGAPPEMVERLTAVRQEFEARRRGSAASRDHSKDPELDQFMEAYYDMLVKYQEELTRPLQEAMDFITRIESQLNLLTIGTTTPLKIFSSGTF